MRLTVARAGAAYTALALAGGYGAMKLQWALGGEFLMDQTPLPASARDHLLDHRAGTVVQDVAGVALAVLGALAALHLAGHFRPLGRIRRRVLLVGAWSGCVFMTARALGLLGYGFYNDLRLLGGFASVSPADEAEARHQAQWDVFLWSPYWLLFAIAWGVAAWCYQQQATAATPTRRHR
jgi:hypothetical protein